MDCCEVCVVCWGLATQECHETHVARTWLFCTAAVAVVFRSFGVSKVESLPTSSTCLTDVQVSFMYLGATCEALSGATLRAAAVASIVNPGLFGVSG